MARSTALGDAHEITLASATVRYWECGEGQPIVFVHGLLVNADLWRHITPALSVAGFRCLAPDWPLGRTRCLCRAPISARPAWPTWSATFSMASTFTT
jgi:hypothetical protein